MSELMRLDEEYRSWIQELGDRYRTSQIKASIRVNNEMLMYYWSVGKDITERRADSKWGNKFFKYEHGYVRYDSQCKGIFSN